MLVQYISNNVFPTRFFNKGFPTRFFWQDFSKILFFRISFSKKKFPTRFIWDFSNLFWFSELYDQSIFGLVYLVYSVATWISVSFPKVFFNKMDASNCRQNTVTLSNHLKTIASKASRWTDFGSRKKPCSSKLCFMRFILMY